MTLSFAVNSGDKYKWIKWLWQTQIGIFVSTIFLSLAVLWAAALIYHAQPLTVLLSLLEGAFEGSESTAVTLSNMAMLILIGLAVLLPYKAGFFNVCGQAELEMGGIAAVVVATNLSGPPLVVILLALMAAAVAGAVTILIPLLLKVKLGANEVTTTIMMIYICSNLQYALISGPLKDPSAFYATTRLISKPYQLPTLTLFSGASIHIGVFAAIAIAIIVFWLMKRTVFGMELSAVGFNSKTAETSGISVNKVLVMSVLAGVAIAGLAGGVEVLGVTHCVAQNWDLQWGFYGICVAFLGTNALGVVPVALILSILEIGAQYMQAMTGVPAALVDIMQGIPILIFVSLNASLFLRRSRQIKKSMDSNSIGKQKMSEAV